MRLWRAVAMLALVGCRDEATAPTPAVPHLKAVARASSDPAVDTNRVQSCDDPNAVQDCVPDDEAGANGWPFFGSYSSNLYEAPYDPSPGTPGVWLGSSVSPSACFGTGNAFRTSSDRDGDGLNDNCEFSIARSFSPLLYFYQGENCGNGEPHWAAKRFPNGAVRIAYMMAYYRDCGYSGHTGDSELVMVEVFYNGATQHWT